MKPRHLATATLAALSLFTLSSTAQAALVSLGDGTVKDTNTNLIWLQNWNVNGQQNWSTQEAWAEGLDFAGSTDWKLPEISEYAALFSAYGNLTQRGEFTNAQFDYYWSGTEVVAGGGTWGSLPGSWGFIPGVGFQAGGPQILALYAVAVRPGDVTAAVPEPQTLALTLLAMAAAATAARRRTRGCERDHARRSDAA